MLIWLTALSVGVAHAATACPTLTAKQINFKSLTNAIKNPACNIRSVSDAIKFLPAEARRTYSLFYRSRSLQGPSKTDFKSPRAVLKINDDFMLTFNKDPKHQGSLSFETVEINTKGNKRDLDVLKYREIKFPFTDAEAAGKSWKEVRQKMHFSGANPKKCVACHGKPPRPIYPGYPDWDGSFGSQHFERPLPEEDVRGMREYGAALEIEPNSRYSLLEPVAGIKEGAQEAYDHFDGANDRINARLGEANAVRVARLIAQTPDYKKFRYAFLAALLRCDNYPDYFPQEVGNGLLENIDRRFGLRNKWPEKRETNFLKEIFNTERQFLLSEHTDGVFDGQKMTKKPFPEFKNSIDMALGKNPDFRKLQLDTFSLQNITRADPLGANLRMIMEGRGLKIDSWFLDLTQPTYRYHNGANATEATILELNKIDPILNKELAESLKPTSVGFIEKDKPCAILKKLSNASLKDQRVKSVPIKASVDSGTEAGNCCGPDKKKTAAHAAYPDTFKHTCTQCHDDKIHLIGPPIPFTSPEKMSMWLATGDNRNLMRNKIQASDEEGRMPPTRRLEEEEKSAIIEFLKP